MHSVYLKNSYLSIKPIMSVAGVNVFFDDETSIWSQFSVYGRRLWWKAR